MKAMAEAVIPDGTVRTYYGEHEKQNRAVFLAEKKARAWLRNKGYSMRYGNIVKTRCPDCPEGIVMKTNFEAQDVLPEETQGPKLDEFDWMLDDWHM